MTDILPIGAVVTFEHDEKRCPMVIVAHSPGNARDPETLYFAREYRGDLVHVSPPDAPMYSLDYLTYNLEAGWGVGNCDRHLLRDTGKRVKVIPYAASKRS